jgi:hypothetical protein
MMSEVEREESEEPATIPVYGGMVRVRHEIVNALPRCVICGSPPGTHCSGPDAAYGWAHVERVLQ